MTWYYEEMGAEAPFDDTDEVIKTKTGATPARSWQHTAARAIVALMRHTAELRDAFSLRDWPQPKRVELIKDVIMLIDTFEDDPGTIAERIFEHVRNHSSVDQQFEEMVTQDELSQMIEDTQSYIEETRHLAVG